jgi:hypothetical protein
MTSQQEAEMKRNWGITFIVAVAVICLLRTAVSPQASACDVTIFSKTYIRETQKPEVFTDTFSSSKPSGNYTLTVKNGKNGSFRVSAALIWINGKAIVGVSDFNNQVALITRPVALKAANEIKVELRGKPGDFIAITIVGIVKNTPPVANAGPNQTVRVSSTVQLDGSGSSDVDNDPLTYCWSIFSKPVGSTATLSNLSAVKPTFIADKPGTYVAKLIVNDGIANSAPATTTITVLPAVVNQPPIVAAGPSQTIILPGTAILNGAATDDGLPAGSTLTILWSKISGPGTVTFSNPNALSTAATFSVAGIYVLRLAASDSALSSTSDVIITVNPGNQAPVVNAGSAQTITLPATATLNGTATDDGLPTGSALSVAWSKFSGPSTVTFSNPNALSSTATFSAAGIYVLRLTASDGALSSTSDVTITVNPGNQAPVVNAGSAQTITLPATAALNGTATDDGLPTGSTLSIAWSKFSGPGTVTFSNPNALSTTAGFSVAGIYTLRLTASDSALSSTSDVTVRVNPGNRAPIVDAGSAQTITLPATVALIGSATDDGLPVGSTLTFLWSKLSGPGTVTFSNSSTLATTATFSVSGTYILRLTASDGALSSISDVTITVNTGNQAPVVNAGSAQTITLPATVVLNGTATDDGLPVGSMLTILWSKVSGPGTVTLSNATALVTPASFSIAGTYVLRLTASDSQLTNSSDVTITVNPAPAQPPIAADDVYSTEIAKPLSITKPGVLGNDADADGRPLAAVLVKGPTHGDLSLNADGSFSYTPWAPTPGAPLNPVIKWAWTSSTVLPNSLNVMSTPAVVDLDGDGVPEIIFGSSDNTTGAWDSPGVLRALRGDTGAELFTVTDPSLAINFISSVAVGDIDGDGHPEIIACGANNQSLIAFNHDGTFKWRSPALEYINGGAPALADLDGDGKAEIIIGRQVLNSDGSLRWTGTGSNGSKGTGALPIVADIDLDGKPEVIVGNTAYRADGTTYWQIPTIPGGGFNAIGNFDNDAYPEIVIVGAGFVYLFKHDGTLIWQQSNISGLGSGGPPTVADFDGDGKLEIGIAGHSNYYVFDASGNIKWSSPTQDYTSEVTGSSVFDFDGDGAPEVVYHDETMLRVFRGKDGYVLFETPMSSCTAHEYALVADVDADNSADIVAVANNNCGIVRQPQRGVYVFSGTNWIPTRKIWNQHSYHVTNINEDGTIPRVEDKNWLLPGLNNYRLNAYSPRDLATVDTFIYKANDGQLDSNIATVSIKIVPGNKPPVVNPGLTQTVTLPASAFLNGAATDDGLPIGGGLTMSWSEVSGPGTVNFGDSNAAVTTASFSAAGTYILRLTANDSQLSSSADITINAGTSTLALINPSSGKQGQNNLNVAITGQFTNFLNSQSTASFSGSGITVNSITVMDATHAIINITIADNAPIGPCNITITTNAEVATLANGFAVTASAPILTLINPNSGQQGQSNLNVAITGRFTNFINGMSVASFSDTSITVNNTTVTDTTHASANITIAGNAPLGACDITVTTGVEVATIANGFTVTGPPVITLISPSSGQQGQAGISVAITGQFANFLNGTSKAGFSGTGITVNSTTVTDATHAIANITIASNAPLGLRNVTVATGAEVAILANSFAVTGPPVITLISPGSLLQGQAGINVAITGYFTNFVNGTSVASFSGTGIAVNSTTVMAATYAIANITIADNAPMGARNITVTTNTEVATLANNFTVIARVPILTLINPSNGQQGQENFSVAITGQFTNFRNGASVVSFSGTGITVNSIMVTDATHAIANITIASNAPIGPRNVTVTTGTEVVSQADSFSVTGKPILTLTTPNSGQQGQADISVAITGQFTNFINGMSVASFSSAGITVSNTTVTDATHATANITIAGNAPIGPCNVTVTTGTEVVSLANSFAVTAGAPVLIQITPNSGQQGQAGIDVAITGQFTNFSNSTSVVSFSGTGITVNSTTVANSTHATANITIANNAATGVRDVTVTTGAEVASLAGSFAVVGAPVLTVITPNGEQQGQADLNVTITGQFTNFVNGTSAAGFSDTGITVHSTTVTDATHATANITIADNAPLGARNVTVTTGAEVATLANGFTIIAAPMKLQLGQNVITAGKNIPFVFSFFDSIGQPVVPSTSPACDLAATFTGLNQGTMPAIGAGVISTSNDTRGGFRLTCSLDSLSQSQEFVVIEPDGEVPSQPGLYSTLSKSLTDIGNGLSNIASALQQGQPSSIPALHAALLASRDAVNLIETRNSTAFSPEGGFPPTTEELSAQGFYPTSDDAALSNLVDSITAKIISSTSFINGLDPSSLTDADGAQLNQLNADLAALQSQFQALNPSIYGVVAASGRMNQLLAVYLPNYLYATVNKADQALTSNGYSAHMLAPGEFYMLPGGQRRPLPTLDTPSAFYGKARPAFFGLIDIMISQSTMTRLVVKLYGPTIKALVKSAMLLEADGLLKSYFKAASLDGIITGAESLTINVFNAQDSFIEGEGFNPLPLRNEVWLVGPDALGAVEKVGDLFTKLPSPPTWKDYKGVYEFFQQVRALIKSTIEARDNAIEVFNRANQPPDWTSQGYGIFGNESAIDLIYDLGFNSVYTDEKSPDLPQPVLVIVHNLDGGYAMGIYSFLKDVNIRK